MVSTKLKIFIASVIYKFLKKIFGLPFINLNIEKIKIKRNNINWLLDLSEGIDLSIFIFGSSEKDLLKLKTLLNKDKVYNFIDIGANIGSTSLLLAQIFKYSKIYAIEPTFYAFKKFQTNLSLNNNFSERVYLHNCLISNKQINTNIYSSWKLDKLEHDRHELHLGSPKEFTEKFIKLDTFVKTNQIPTIDFIKIDVDGNEKFVLDSAIETLKKFKPIIFLELAPYLYKDNNYTFDDLYEIFDKLGYKFFDSKLKIINDIKNFVSQIKKGSSRNIFLV